MTLEFNPKRRRQRLSAKEINALNADARNTRQPRTNAFGLLKDGQSLVPPPFHLRWAIVVAEEFELGRADGIDGLYEIRFRYFDDSDGELDAQADSSDSSSSSSSSSSSESSGSNSDGGAPNVSLWKTDEDGGVHFLDATVNDLHFNEGDLLAVYWDDQRDTWLPSGGGGGLIHVMYVDTDKVLGDSFSGGVKREGNGVILDNLPPGRTTPNDTDRRIKLNCSRACGIVLPYEDVLASYSHGKYWVVNPQQHWTGILATDLAPGLDVSFGDVRLSGFRGSTVDVTMQAYCATALPANTRVWGCVRRANYGIALWLDDFCCPPSNDDDESSDSSI